MPEARHRRTASFFLDGTFFRHYAARSAFTCKSPPGKCVRPLRVFSQLHQSQQTLDPLGDVAHAAGSEADPDSGDSSLLIHHKSAGIR